jgi:Tol biopolymer transport system component
MPGVKEVYEMVTQQTPPQPDALERQRNRQRRHTMNRKLGALAVVAAIAALALLVLRDSAGDVGQLATNPTDTGSLSVPGVPKVDYTIDLSTGVMTPLPEAIIRSRAGGGGQYSLSPDGSVLAYVGDDGISPQIFTAGVDGSGVREMTHDPTGAVSPAWSPDGTRIAYVGYGSGDVRNLFVLDVATGESTQIGEGGRVSFRDGLQFTPDGSSILYTGRRGSPNQSLLWTVPAAGGKSTVLIGGRGDLFDAFNGSLSPDGSLVTFLGTGIGRPGPHRWVANANGTERRRVPCNGWVDPSGTWSPDGNRIVCPGSATRVVVVDSATGDASPAAEGSGAIWLDGHTLLVEV